MFYEDAPYIFRSRKSTQAISDRTMTNIGWTVTEASSQMTASTAGFTADVPGVYLINVSCFYTAEAGFDGVVLRLIGGGSNWISAMGGSDATGTGNSVLQTGTCMCRLAAGDTIGAQVYTIVNPASGTVIGTTAAEAEMFITAAWIGKY